MISMFTMITVAAKNLISGRIAIILEPFVKSGSMMSEIKFFSKLTSIIIDMINCQKIWFCFTAAGTTIAAVSHYRFVLKPVIICKGIFSTLFRVLLVPFCGTDGIDLSQMWSTLIFSQPRFGAFSPSTSVFMKTIVALTAMPLSLCFCFSASGTSFSSRLFFCCICPLVTIVTVFAYTVSPFFLVFLLTTFGTDFNHGITCIIKTLFDYEINVKWKAQRPSRKGVGTSVPKRLAPGTGDDMVCSAWKLAAAL